jgi:hypothetical protein
MVGKDLIRFLSILGSLQTQFVGLCLACAICTGAAWSMAAYTADLPVMFICDKIGLNSHLMSVFKF